MDVNGDERLQPAALRLPGLRHEWAASTRGSPIMGALYHRERTGEGQFIDIAMLDSIMR